MNQKGFSQIILILIIVGAVLVLGGGIWYYQQSVKQSEPAPETQGIPGSSSGQAPSAPDKPQKQTFNILPSLIQAEFADNVTAEDKNFVIQGISAMDFYLKKWFGKSINQPAGLRVDALESTRSEVVVENGKMVILIGTRSSDWKGMIELNKYGGESRPRIPAHEYVHVYQFHNGCGRLDVETYIAPRWFAEGEAEWLSYKAMQEADLISSFGFPQFLIPLAKQETGLLKSFESKGEWGMSIPRYSLFNMAVDYLMKNKPIKTLDDFCVNLADGKGMSMPKAFEAAFGITLEKFYGEFESYRKTWSGESSSGQGQISQGYCASFASTPSCSYVGAPGSQNYNYCKQCFPDK